MARNNDDNKKPRTEKRAFKKMDERVRVSPLRQADAKLDSQRRNSTSSLDAADGFSTARISEQSDSGTFRALDASSESESSTPDFSKVKFSEKWEENILALEKGEIPGEELKARGSHNRKFTHVKEIFGQEQQAVKNEMIKYTELLQTQQQMAKIENDPDKLRKFLSSATTWATKAKKLEIPGADKFSDSIKQFQQDHLNKVKDAAKEQRLTSTDRRQKFAESRQKAHHFEHETPKPGKR